MPDPVQVVPGLRVRFPGRSAEFSEGVEVGLALAVMAAGERRSEHHVSADSVEEIMRVARSELRVELGTELHTVVGGLTIE